MIVQDEGILQMTDYASSSRKDNLTHCRVWIVMRIRSEMWSYVSFESSRSWRIMTSTKIDLELPACAIKVPYR